jgi:two-component system, NtrC family, response regulator
VSSRIVVIDDEPEVCELIGKVLVRAGHEVHAAHSGESGLALLEQHDVQCLVVDKLLPQMGGLEVVAAVRQRWPAVAIVLVTAHPEPFNLEAERPEVVLAKPFKTLEAIEDAVHEALEAMVAQQAQRKDPLTQLRDRVAAVVAEMTPGRRKRE